jgi:hypothetical protein
MKLPAQVRLTGICVLYSLKCTQWFGLAIGTCLLGRTIGLLMKIYNFNCFTEANDRRMMWRCKHKYAPTHLRWTSVNVSQILWPIMPMVQGSKDVQETRPKSLTKHRRDVAPPAPDGAVFGVGLLLVSGFNPF